jgi:basic membrane protein A
MRRYIALALTVALVMVAAALPVGAAPPTKVSAAYDAAGLGDLSFNDLVHEGAVQAENDFGIKLFEMEQVKRNGMLIDQETMLTRLAKRSDLVIAAGFAWYLAAELAAASNPDTNFAVIDIAPAEPLLNLLGTTTAVNEGSFLVGAAAALKLESTAGQFGFIGGADLPVILEFEAGFVAGIDYIDPTASVTVEYVSLFPDFSGFQDPERAYEIATDMYESGIEVIYQAAGGSGIGVFEAALDYTEESGEHVWVIGVDIDQYRQVADDIKPHILTSMIKRIDVITYDIIKSQALGTFTGGHEHWDLSRNGVDYATSGGFIDDYVPTLEAIKQDIIDEDISVPTIP